MRHITTVLSDIGNVVQFYDEMRACLRLSELSVHRKSRLDGSGFIDADYVREIVFGPHSAHGLYQRGRISTGQVIRLLRALLYIPSSCDDALVADAYNDCFTPNQPVIELWTACYDRDLGVTAVSDTEELRVMRMRKDRLLGLFDHHVFSNEEGMTKTDGPEIFIRALDLSGCKAEDALFVDDRQACLDVAAGVGIRTFLYDAADHKALQKELFLLAGVPLFAPEPP